MQDTHSTSEMEQMLQNNCMFACVHSTQKENWCLVKAIIVTHTNSFLKQQEQKGIILFSKKMIIISLLY